MAECGWNIHGAREVCNGYPEEVWDVGLKGHDHTYGIEHEAIEQFFIESINATMYRQMIGSLMYLMNARPYIFFAMNTLS